jgi:exopolyphosphatase/guanosine-5'-triphosphate,3'-diphosphate pyrophosphatase
MDKGTDSGSPSPLPGQVTDAAGAPVTASAEKNGEVRAPASAPAPDRSGSPGPGAGSGDRRAGNERLGGERGGRYGRRERGPFYAALDLGTNNCRLLIAEPAGETFRVVDSFSRIVRLGEGVAQSGRLGDAAMDRAVGALRICAQKLDLRPMARVRLIATQACRVAENGEEFLRRVSAEVGIDLEIADRRTEARLAAEGCFSLLDQAAHGAVLFDIG